MLANRYTYPYHPNGSLYLLADTMLKQLVFDKPRVFVVPPLVLAALVLHQDAEHCVQQWPRKLMMWQDFSGQKITQFLGLFSHSPMAFDSR